MHYHKSLLKKLKEECFGIYYDYRKIAFVFFCYSLLGTGLILGTSSFLDEDVTFHHTTDKEQKTEKAVEEVTTTETVEETTQPETTVAKAEPDKAVQEAEVVEAKSEATENEAETTEEIAK